ncbi:MAG TPA: type II secretion system protein [Chthoniobacterales bacterium]
MSRVSTRLTRLRMASRCSLGREWSWIIARVSSRSGTRPWGQGHGSAYVLLMETIMSSPSRPFRSHRCLQHRAAFTLIEIVIALAVLGTMAAGCFLGFNAVNTYGVSSRLYSEAQTAAQNQIDLILSRAPFDPSTSGAYVSGTFNPALNKIPVELMTVAELDALGTIGVVFPAVPPTTMPAKTDPYYPYYPYYRDGKTPNVLKKQAFIYHDPVTGLDVVKGVLASTITDAGMAMSFVNATPTNLNTRKAIVSVTYDFRGRSYDVSVGTLRAGDQ